ncbi:hypothetical protein CEXT_550381 [Caerostris extrusa]|uniref:C2H2-type domain-containing protein n=1 Tax=Caerostris extrusa TaxID=172846 RepID=A0AAV4R934_CAEEX|nr:hypothetical protein CEXT_550381 [Caerostris extrusa]
MVTNKAAIKRFTTSLKGNYGVYLPKRFQCLHCAYAAPSNADLKKHNLTHTGERPHGCHICGRRFLL